MAPVRKRLKTTTKPPPIPKSFAKPVLPSKQRDNPKPTAKPAPKPTKPAKQRAREPSPSSSSSSSSSEDEDDTAPASEYTLVPSTTKIPYARISKKWEPLPSSSLQALNSLLHTAESAILTSIAPTSRTKPSNTTSLGADRQRAVAQFISTLVRSFPKVPVMEGKWEFDVARLRARGEEIEERVEAERRAVEEGKVEVRRLERVVEEERRALEELRRNAKDQEAARKAREKNMHPILLDDDEEIRKIHGLNVISLDTRPENHALRNYDISSDASLTKLESNLRMHLGSMQANLAQVEGVGNALSRSRAVVREVMEEMGREDVVERVEAAAMVVTL